MATQSRRPADRGRLHLRGEKVCLAPARRTNYRACAPLRAARRVPVLVGGGNPQNRLLGQFETGPEKPHRAPRERPRPGATMARQVTSCQGLAVSQPHSTPIQIRTLPRIAWAATQPDFVIQYAVAPSSPPSPGKHGGPRPSCSQRREATFCVPTPATSPPVRTPHSPWLSSQYED